jgi:hypothetical protein
MRSIGSRRSVLGLLMFSVLLIVALAAPAWAQQPPIIDRELFFGDPEIAGAQISPDGAFIAFIKPFKGTRNVWVKKTSEPFANAKPVTADTKRPIPAYFWSRDGKYRYAAVRSRRAGREKSDGRKGRAGRYLCGASQRARRDLRRH